MQSCKFYQTEEFYLDKMQKSNSVYQEDSAKALVEKINLLALEKKISLGTAESCTGGNISSQIVELAGVSAWFLGAIVCYANSVKQNLLKVKKTTLQKKGAVSQECLSQMLTGACAALNTDLAIGVSGIAGPAGGKAEKPVGTVFIGVGGLNASTHKIKKYQFHGDRKSIQQQAKVQALTDLKIFLKNLP